MKVFLPSGRIRRRIRRRGGRARGGRGGHRTNELGISAENPTRSPAEQEASKISSKTATIFRPIRQVLLQYISYPISQGRKRAAGGMPCLEVYISAECYRTSLVPAPKRLNSTRLSTNPSASFTAPKSITQSTATHRSQHQCITTTFATRNLSYLLFPITNASAATSRQCLTTSPDALCACAVCHITVDELNAKSSPRCTQPTPGYRTSCHS